MIRVEVPERCARDRLAPVRGLGAWPCREVRLAPAVMLPMTPGPSCLIRAEGPGGDVRRSCGCGRGLAMPPEQWQSRGPCIGNGGFAPPGVCR